MKRASYRDAIDWIAQNDESGAEDRFDIDQVRFYTTTVLISDLFGVSTEKVGEDIIRRRRRIEKEERREAEMRERNARP